MTERERIIERLRNVDLGGGSHESLSAICKAVLPHQDAWTLRRCADLRDRLVELIGCETTTHSSVIKALADKVEHELRRQYNHGYDAVFASIADELADVQPPYSQLLALLRDEWHIDCSWDGLRKFWNVERTDEGVSERAERDAAIAAMLRPEVTQDTSDGYHTFRELYHHRALLFSVVVRDHTDLAWKSKAHHDGTMYDGMFIVGIETPKGQATYHYDIEPYWEMFDCKEVERAPEWDGHTPDEAIARIATLGRRTCHKVRVHMQSEDEMHCSECGRFLGFAGDVGAPPYNFCPNCGRKVVDE